jgi:hypothetical protein
MAGDLTIEQCANIFASPSRQASSNYGIDSKGRIGMYVEEKNRSWCTSNAANDHRAITIEVASRPAKEPWTATEQAMNSLIKLCADICERNNIKKLLWKGDKSLIGQVDKQNMTVHRWFSKKACLPIRDTELLTRYGWVPLGDIGIGNIIASVNISDRSIKFSPVLDVVESRKELVYELAGLRATTDHRIFYVDEDNKEYVSTFEEVLNKYDKEKIYFYNSGIYQGSRLDLSNDEIELLIAIKLHGRYSHYFDNFTINGISSKLVNRLLTILFDNNYDHDIYHNDDKSISVAINSPIFRNIYMWYINKDNTWKTDILDLSPNQVKHFISKIQLWSSDQNSYFINHKDIDTIRVLAALNDSSIKIDDNGIEPRENKRLIENPKDAIEEVVSCVTVDSGFIIIRQKGSITIVGNCPGDYLYNKHGYIADKVNELLNGSKVVEIPEKPITPSIPTDYPCSVKIKTHLLNYRTGPGIEYDIVGTVKRNQIFTILEEVHGWGKLKSGAGWIKLIYTEKV